MISVLEKTLTINEIFFSIQGESYLVGLPCVFIRLTGCHQRCTYCDTEYAFYEGKKMTLAEIMQAIEKFNCKNVLLTGGEPLLQGNCPALADLLLAQGYQVAIETSGNRKLDVLPEAVIKVMDLKTPGSREEHRNNYDNLKSLSGKDEVKFVVTNAEDLNWALQTVEKFSIDQISHVSFSPTDLKLLPMMAEAILQSGKSVRLQMQMHKIIWPAKDRGY